MASDDTKRRLDRRGWLDPQGSPVLPLLFLLLIFLPLAAMVLRFGPAAAGGEKRKLAARPDFSWRRPLDYLKGYEAYFNDHFAFRSQMIQAHSRLLFRLFHASATEKVIIGRQGWLYLGRGNYFNNEIDYYRAARPFTLQQLQGFKAVLEERREWLARRGIRYLLVLVPNKSTIYPEYMPTAFNRVHERSRLDQLLDYLSRRSRVEVLDLRPALLREKRRARVYHKTDSHWNERGGYRAYCEILARLRRLLPEAGPLPPLEVAFASYDGPGGDLAVMLSLQRDIFRETCLTARPRHSLRARPGRPTPGFQPRAPWVSLTASECPTGRIPAAVMVRDSFAHQLQPFLSEHFRRIVYIWDWELHFFPGVIERERPSLVIDQMAERSLLSILPENPGALAAP